MIYDYIWTAVGAIKLCYGDRIYTITYRTSHWESARGLRVLGHSSMWIMANKQIMEEGLLQLRRHAAWHINDGAARFESLEESEYIASILLPSSVVYLDAKEDTGLYYDGFDEPYDKFPFRDRWKHLPAIVTTHFKDAQAKTFVLKLGNEARGVWRLFDLSLLQQLTGYSQLERFCVQVETLIEPYYPLHLRSQDLDDMLNSEELCMQNLSGAVATMGRQIIEGGRETITDMEGYWAEFKEVYESGKKRHVLF